LNYKPPESSLPPKAGTPKRLFDKRIDSGEHDFQDTGRRIGKNRLILARHKESGKLYVETIHNQKMVGGWRRDKWVPAERFGIKDEGQYET
jgi:hypothetical protein